MPCTAARFAKLKPPLSVDIYWRTGDATRRSFPLGDHAEIGPYLGRTPLRSDALRGHGPSRFSYPVFMLVFPPLYLGYVRA